MKCANCGGPSEKKFCKTTCKSYFHLKNWRRRTKAKAVALLGGKCQECGYSKCLGALIFHHPGHKSFGIGNGISWPRIEAELKKCVLLCLNCHTEEHCENEECTCSSMVRAIG